MYAHEFFLNCHFTPNDGDEYILDFSVNNIFINHESLLDDSIQYSHAVAPTVFVK